MNIFKLELRNMRRGAVIGTAVISGVIFLLLAFFPSMQTESMASLTSAKMEGIDPALLAALGISQMIDFTIITNFFGYVLQFITLALMVMYTGRAVSLIGREEADGTIEYLYAKPVTRGEIFWQKLLAHIAALAASLLVYLVITAIGYLLFSDFTFGAAIKEIFIFYAAIFFVGLVFTAVGVLFSVLIRPGGATGGVTIGAVFFSFLLGIMSVTVPQLDFFIYFSPMDWIKSSKLMSDGIAPGEWAVGIAVIVLCVAAARWRYEKKDLLA